MKGGPGVPLVIGGMVVAGLGAVLGVPVLGIVLGAACVALGLAFVRRWP